MVVIDFLEYVVVPVDEAELVIALSRRLIVEVQRVLCH
jgi:hypothetical protein